jgi:hypothetical protein
VTVRFVYRAGCSLCDAMWQELEAFRRRQDDGGRFSIELVDIANAPALEREYGLRIPVLEAGGRQICAYFFDEEALLAYLRQSPIAV